MIQLNYLIRSFHNGNVVQSCGVDWKWVSVTVRKQSDNLLGTTEKERRVGVGGGQRASEGNSKTEALKRHEDDCQFNDNYSLRKKKNLKSTEKKNILSYGFLPEVRC